MFWNIKCILKESFASCIIRPENSAIMNRRQHVSWYCEFCFQFLSLIYHSFITRFYDMYDILNVNLVYLCSSKNASVFTSYLFLRSSSSLVLKWRETSFSASLNAFPAIGSCAALKQRGIKSPQKVLLNRVLIYVFKQLLSRQGFRYCLVLEADD